MNLRRAQALKLNEKVKNSLDGIYLRFSMDSNHFKDTQYPLDMLKLIFEVFDQVNLSYFNEKSRNDPAIVDASIVDSLKSLKFASKSAIIALLNNKNSTLVQKLSLYSYAREYLNYYPYDVDVDLFIKLMEINPAIIETMPEKKLLAILRDPAFRQATNKPDLWRIYKNKAQGDYAPVATNIEIILEIYLHHEKDILSHLYYSIEFADNHYKRSTVVKKLFVTYPDAINLADIIGLHRVVDQDSLTFVYDEKDDAIICSGKLVIDSKEDKNFSFSKKNKIMAEGTSLFKSVFINQLASNLQPQIFCKMIAAIPVEKRAHYLFATKPKGDYASESAYHAFKDKLARSEDRGNYPEETQIQKPENQAHLDALNKLIYPVPNVIDAELKEVKKQACASLKDYTAWWKLSIFGHHHEARARQVINTINQASTVAEIGLIIKNQLALLENKVNDPFFRTQNREFILTSIFKKPTIDWQAQKRWYSSVPRNLPPQKSLTSSGYYRALITSKSVIEQGPSASLRRR